MSGPRPLSILRRRWTSVLLMVVLGLLAGLGYLLMAPVTYAATASAYFSLTQGSSASDLVQGSTYAQNQVDSFARLATTPAVLGPVVDDLDLDVEPVALARQVAASVPVGTVIVEVTFTDRSPERSAELANAVIASLSRVVEDLSPVADDGEPTVLATTIAPAEVPTDQAAPNVPLVLLAALVGGLVAGGGLAWLRETLDTRVRDAAAVAALTSRPLIGTLGVDPTRNQRAVMASEPHSPQAEAYRHLRTNLQFLDVGDHDGGRGGRRVIGVTSSLAAEGKSTVAVNLALSLAETSARVLLVDADLRRPSIATKLGLEGAAGLTTVLLGRARVSDVVQDWGSTGLEVLTSGALPPNPTDLLGSPAMRALLRELRDDYDFVVLDSPPLLPVADGVVLAGLVDGTIMLANATKVRRHQLAESLRNLEQVGAPVLGVVLNQVVRDDRVYGYTGNTEVDPDLAAAGSRAGAVRLPVRR